MHDTCMVHECPLHCEHACCMKQASHIHITLMIQWTCMEVACCTHGTCMIFWAGGYLSFHNDPLGDKTYTKNGEVKKRINRKSIKNQSLQQYVIATMGPATFLSYFVPYKCHSRRNLCKKNKAEPDLNPNANVTSCVHNARGALLNVFF